MQGLYGPWKTWKVMEFYNGIFQDWKVLEKTTGPGKSWKSVKLKSFLVDIVQFNTKLTKQML